VDSFSLLPKTGSKKQHCPKQGNQLAGVLVVVLGAALAGFTSRVDSAAQPAVAGKEVLSRQELLERFDQLTPAARLELLDKVSKADKEFQPAVRGDLIATVVARGALEPAQVSDIYCKVRALNKPSTIATTIKSVVDDGTRVKKGDVLLVLDSSAFEDQLKDKMKDFTQAQAAKVQAEQQLAIQELDNQADILRARNNLDLARIDLEKYLKSDYPLALKDVDSRMALARADLEDLKALAAVSADQAKKGLGSQAKADADALRVDAARLHLAKVEEEKRVLVDFTRARTEIDLKGKLSEAERNLEKTALKAKLKLEQLKAQVDAGNTILDQESARLKEIKEQIENCTIKSPMDGVVMYYVPEQVRGGGGSQQAIVAQGEPVREGQLLLQVYDPKHWRVRVRIPEALIPLVQIDQKATVRFDAFPMKVLAGRVQWIADKASGQDWFAADVKVFPVLVALPPEQAYPRPGMTAEVIIETARKTGVVQVPVQAVVRVGQAHYCYVQTGKEIHKRKVVPGVRNDQVMEIKEGLQEGERVLRNLDGMLKRLSPLLSPPGGPEPKKTAGRTPLRSALSSAQETSAGHAQPVRPRLPAYNHRGQSLGVSAGRRAENKPLGPDPVHTGVGKRCKSSSSSSGRC
jgi:RND family efflux transporter MFP subunit